MHISLADREAEIMQVLWEHGPSTVAEVRALIGDELAYTTVLSVLRTLEAKGLVHHEDAGRAHRYNATVSREAAQRSALRALASKLFKGSLELLLTRAVRDEPLTDKEVQRIRRLLSGRKKRTGKS